MPNLSFDHPYLYKRVRLKAVVHLALGAVLVFLPQAVPAADAGKVTSWVVTSLTIFGFGYLLIGGALAAGIFRSHRNYRLARWAMGIAVIYNFFWCLLFIGIMVDQPNRSTAYVAILYFYLTYNCYYVFNDPGWRAIEILKEQEHGHDQRAI